MYVYDSINTVYVRLCTLMTIVMSFTVLDSHKPNSEHERRQMMQGCTFFAPWKIEAFMDAMAIPAN